MPANDSDDSASTGRLERPGEPETAGDTGPGFGDGEGSLRKPTAPRIAAVPWRFGIDDASQARTAVDADVQSARPRGSTLPLEPSPGSGGGGSIRWFAERVGADPDADELTPRYQLGELLGIGGVGEVREGYDVRLRRHVAIKTLRLADPDEETLRRFLLEAQVAAQLEHPGIAPVYDVGVGPGGGVYFAMRLVHGRSLSELITRDEVGSQAKRLEIFLKICDTVAFAHSRGIVHRDLKPSNVIVGDYGEVVLVDWGLAKVFGHREDGGAGGVDADEDADGVLSRAGRLLGTPSYMAPEQADGDPNAVGPHTDVHSLGAVLYALLTGQAPYPRGLDALAAVRSGRLVPPSVRAPGKVPRELDAVTLRAMRRRPEERYGSVDALRTDVRAFLARRPVSVVTYSGAERLAKWAGRHRRILVGTAAAVIAALAAVLLAGVVYVRDVSRARRRAEAAEHASAVRLADGEVALALASAEDGRVDEAHERLAAARRIYAERNVSPLRARIAGSYVSHLFPPPVVSWRSRPGTSFRSAIQSADGATLLAGDSDGVLRVFALPGGRLLGRRTVAPGNREPWASGFVRGRPAAIEWRSGGADVVDVATGEAIAALEGLPPVGTLDGAMISADGEVLLVGGPAFGSRIWSTRTGRAAGPVIPEAWVTAISADGTRGVGRERSGVPGADLRRAEESLVWNLRTGERLAALPTDAPMGISPDGRLVAWAGTADVGVTEVDGGKELWRIEVPGQTDGAFYGADERLVLVNGAGIERRSGVDGRLYGRWPQTGLSTSLASFDLASSGERLVAFDSSRLVVLDLPDGNRGNAIRVSDRELNSVAVSADGLLIALGGWDGRVPVYEMRSFVLLRDLGADDRGTRDVAFSPDGSRLLAAGRDGRCRLWNLRAATIEREIDACDGIAMGVAFLPDGRRAFVACDTGTLALWDLESGAEAKRYRPATGDPWDLELSPDGRLLLISGRGPSDPAMEVWDVSREAAVYVSPELGPAYGAAISPDGLTFAVATHLGRVLLRRPRDAGAVVPDLSINEVLMGVAFSPDGKLVAGGGYDGRVRLWDARTGAAVQTLALHDRSVDDVRFVPGGTVMLTAGSDGRLVAFDLDLGDRWAGVSPDLDPGDPNDRPERLLAVAAAAALRRDWPLAARFLSEARAAGLPVRHLDLGRALWASGRPDEARAELRAAREAGEALPATIDVWLETPAPPAADMP